MIVQDLIKSARKRRSIDLLAEQIGITGPMLHMVNKGKRACPAWVVGALAIEAGVDPWTAIGVYLRSVGAKEEEKALWTRLLDAKA